MFLDFFLFIAGILNSLTCFYKKLCYLPVLYVNYQTCSNQITNFQQVYSFLSNLSEDHFCYNRTLD